MVLSNKLYSMIEKSGWVAFTTLVMLCKSYSIVLKFLLNIFDYLIARVIGFLAMYHDGVLCETTTGRHYLVKICLFWSVMLLHFYFCLFLDCYCIMSEHK